MSVFKMHSDHHVMTSCLVTVSVFKMHSDNGERPVLVPTANSCAVESFPQYRRSINILFITISCFYFFDRNRRYTLRRDPNKPVLLMT